MYIFSIEFLLVYQEFKECGGCCPTVTALLCPYPL